MRWISPVLKNDITTASNPQCIVKISSFLGARSPIFIDQYMVAVCYNDLVSTESRQRHRRTDHKTLDTVRVHVTPSCYFLSFLRQEKTIIASPKGEAIGDRTQGECQTF